jgi:ribosomal protein S27AE
MYEYGKTERGREVNSSATSRYRKTEKGSKFHDAWYRRTKTDPVKGTELRKKKSVRRSVQYAIATGRLVKGVCEVCGSTNVQAHHDDYNKRLEVRWLCRKHHALIRRKGE